MNRTPSALLPGWLVTVACAIAVVWAIGRGGEAIAQTASSKAAATATATAAAATGSASAAPSSAPAAAPKHHDRGREHGLEPLYGGTMVPLESMPPGTNASPVPSDEIFPPQTISIRFNHTLHVKKFKQTCKVCHVGAYSSTEASDRLMPEPAKTCDNCHDVDHSNLKSVQAGEDENGQCDYCHLGEGAGKGGRVTKMVIPTPNLRMNHKAHLDRNIQCAQCHGMIENLELATREQLPRMAGCFTCHAKPAPSRGEARGDCINCHLTQPNGLMRTSFSTGLLQPPLWLHGAAHTPDWISRHKFVAGGNSQLCSSCHTNEHCTGCHDGKVRPRSVHPNDFISMHPEAARQDNPRCVSCHQLQSFCGDCHRRVGVARDTPSANRLAGRRFHPPPEVWTTGPRGPQHHAFEAQRNLNACVACHTERDCATCHASKGLPGGGGIDPHPVGFASKCRTALKRNPRPCLVCHTSTDQALMPCR
jgi:Cytochrome c7 and related cytochrome c